MADLEDLVSRIPEFSKWNHAEKIKFFAWFLHTNRSKERVTGTEIGRLYDTLHEQKPTGIYPFLVAMEQKNPKEAIRDSAGFRLVKAVRDQFDARYGQRGTTVKVEKLLADLPGKIPDRAESDFLKEALICFHNAAFRAAIVMTWNLTFFHLCDYVLKHKLADFNAEYPKRYPGIHKKAKAPTIATYDDFASDLKESEVTEICRSANSAAHPSTTVITVLQAEEFIHDLVTNVVLTLPL